MKLLSVFILSLTSMSASAWWVCDPAPGGSGCVQVSESFCGYAEREGGFMCFEGLMGGVPESSPGSVKEVESELLRLRRSGNQRDRALAESLTPKKRAEQPARSFSKARQ